MGTSKGYGGPPNGLIPTWLASSEEGETAGPGGDGSESDADNGTLEAAPGEGGGFAGARTAFTRFFKSGSSSALGSAMASYVSGGGRAPGGGGAGGGSGARRAARRMGSSRGAGARLLGVVRDIGQLGPVEALRRLDLADMVDRPAADVFLAMLEFLCPPGGAIDEAISRQAMLEAIGNLDDTGAAEFGDLSGQQLQEFFLDFVVLSIEGRVIADIGSRGFAMSPDIGAVENAQTQLHDFIEGCCRVHLSGLLSGLTSLNNRDIEKRMDEIYEVAFSLIAEEGEDTK